MELFRWLMNCNITELLSTLKRANDYSTDEIQDAIYRANQYIDTYGGTTIYWQMERVERAIIIKCELSGILSRR